MADLRAGMETSGPSLLRDVRVLDEDGKAAVLVSDAREGEVAMLVVLDYEDRVLASRRLTVGH
jgi:hypothetical protein